MSGSKEYDVYRDSLLRYLGKLMFPIISDSHNFSFMHFSSSLDYAIFVVSLEIARLLFPNFN